VLSLSSSVVADRLEGKLIFATEILLRGESYYCLRKDTSGTPKRKSDAIASETAQLLLVKTAQAATPDKGLLLFNEVKGGRRIWWDYSRGKESTRKKELLVVDT